MSVFDKDTFLNQSVTGANETNFTPIPEGEYKNCYIDDIAIRMVKSKDSGDEVPVLDVIWVVPDENVRKLLGMEKPQVKDGIFLDLDEAGNISFGLNKNVKLGRTRDALGQNDPKKPWNLNMLRGAGPATLKITHWSNEKGTFSQVDRVARG